MTGVRIASRRARGSAIDHAARATFEGQVGAALGDLGMIDTLSKERAPGEQRVGDLRRRVGSRLDDGLQLITLVERDGVLHWEQGSPSPIRVGRRARRRGAAPMGGDVLAQFKFEALPTSQVSSFLAGLDAKLTPNHLASPLREMAANQTFVKSAGPRAEGKILLLVHGTFSNCDAMITELGAHAAGKKFLADAGRKYSQVLAFDHRTIGVSPMLNAIELARLFAGSKATVDVICHSRGGLVSQWWSRALPPGSVTPRRFVCVASPLAGTGLAAAPRLRRALDLLANYGRVLGTAAMAVPFLQVGAGLLKVCSGGLSVVGNTPLLDAAVAMVPGLAAQSREGANPELLALRGFAPRAAPEYYAIRSNFESPDPGWAFWKRFRKNALADMGADFVFEGENDLVVDVPSMIELADALRIPQDHVHDFGTNGTVHHCNYFEQPKTVEKLREWLGVA